MASVFNTPQTISGKVKTRTPTQADALSSRYTFLNLQNAEPNLGIPKPSGTSPETYEGYLGLRYALLSNNVQNGLSAWRVWSYDNPRVAFYSIENSLGIGENANPIRINSIVYNNHPYGKNRYNSESLAQNSFNVYSLSGIYLFDSTTVGDPASAVSFVVTESGYVGIGTEYPNQVLTVIGNISASGSLSANNPTIGNWNSLLGSLVQGDVANVATGEHSFAEGNGTVASGDFSHAEGSATQATGDAAHAQGTFSIAEGAGSFAGGTSSVAAGSFSVSLGDQVTALGWASQALGHSSTAAQDFTFMWSDGNLGTATQNISTTRTGQFAVSASGGIFIPGNVGVGTDNNTNSLTVAGLMSGGNIALAQASKITPLTVTDSGEFLIININGVNKAIRLWDYTT